jgi:hypothetical protein
MIVDTALSVMAQVPYVRVRNKERKSTKVRQTISIARITIALLPGVPKGRLCPHHLSQYESTLASAKLSFP